MHLSVQRLEQQGVKFFYENGTACCYAPDQYVEVVREEIARRVALMVPHVPTEGHVPMIRITTEPELRWGACQTCNDPMPAHVGGMCMLCIAGLRGALRAKGRLL